MTNRIGVYICSGCGIGEAIDIEALKKVATDEYKVPVCKSHPLLCGAEGVALLKEDIGKEELDKLVLGACSPRYHQVEFDFSGETGESKGVASDNEIGGGNGNNNSEKINGKITVARVPLREYVAWTQPPGEEDTQMAAEDYIRMYTASIAKQGPAEPFQQETDKSLLVIGGGITGMTSALESAKAGYQVKLVEKEEELGGFARKIKLKIPSSAPYREMELADPNKLVEEVEKHPKISLFKSSQVGSISGQPGEFKVKIKQNGGLREVSAGAIVLATGGKPYDSSKLTHLGIEYENVITSVEFEEMAAAGKLGGKDGGEPLSVAFIQCAGSRDPDHLPYCSSFCCMTSLKQAAFLRSKNRENKAYIIYRDMITPGQYENFYREQQSDPGIFLTKGDVVGVDEDENKGILINVDNSLLGEKVQLKVDLAVLAIGIVPSTQDDPILNLEYRQGPALPEQNYGFPDSHFICFPYETQRTGIYTAGTVRQPMDMNFAQRDATGAAMKSIQSVELTGRGKAVHPRAGDETYPHFSLERCTQCKRCTEECPFGVLDEDDKGTPFLNAARCRRCGICMGACPVQIISFKNYSVDIIGEMIKNINIPDEFEEKPRVLIFACENDSLPVFDMLAMERKSLNPYVRIIPLRCLGGTNLIWISDALSVGIDGVMFMGCRFGDDYQCHFITGSELSNTRLSKVQETIGRLNLESDRIKQFEVTMNDYQKVPKLIDDFMEEIDNFGPNPFKDL